MESDLQRGLKAKAKTEDKSRRTDANKIVEFTAVFLILSLAIFFRFWRLDSVPPGLHFDEAIDVRQGLNILNGARPIYITEGWGREALYYYALAGVMTVVTDNVLALRITAVLLSIFTLLITYLFIRRQTGPLTAWFTIAWFSVTFWPLFTSRFGVRNISLPFMFSLTLLAFWWAWGKLTQRCEEAKEEKRKEAVLAYLPAGALLGLTFYTYQPARFVPILFAAFFLYLLLFHRPEFRSQFWGFVTFGSVAAFVALPLVLAILHNPISGEADRAWTIEPMTQLLAGNLQPVWQNAIATLKMFTISGDPLNSYNVPGRPLFQPAWTGLFFYTGLLIALWRWKQPFYAFVLLWLGIMMAPTVLTISAPNHNRMLAAQTAVFFLAALPIAELYHWKHAAKFRTIPILAGMIALCFSAVSTYDAYFHDWANNDTVADLYNAAVNDIAHYLQDSPNPHPLVINSRSLEDADPYTLAVSLDRTDLNIRWADTGQALALPNGARELQLIVADGRWLDTTLTGFINLPPAALQAERFQLYDLSLAEWDGGTAVLIAIVPTNSAIPTDAAIRPAAFPISFQNSVQLTGIHRLNPTIEPNQPLTFITTWQVQQRGDPIPLAIFMHLLDANNQIVSQQDGLGYPPHGWQPGDQFIHVHHLPTDGLPPGQYYLWFGLYNRDTGFRWPIMQDDQPAGDRVLLGPFTVK